jgi:hypothetical protein
LPASRLVAAAAGWGLLGRLLLMAGGWLLAGSCGCGCRSAAAEDGCTLHSCTAHSWLLLIALCVWRVVVACLLLLHP